MADIYSLELTITGKRIQKSGFRSAIENIALDIDITGTAENIREEDETGKFQYIVKVVGEGNELQLQEFIQRINKINTFHSINKISEDEINSKKIISKRVYPEFIIKRDPSTEIPERMDEAVYYVKDLYKETRSLKEDTNKNFETLHKETCSMKDEISKNLKNQQNETHVLGEESNKNLTGVREETHSLNENINKNFEALHKETSTLREETSKNFETMERKYHTISENLNFFVEIVAEYAKMKEPGLADKVDELKKKYDR